MADVQSLGLHEPSALPYLVMESLLPPDPPQSEYHWQTYTAHPTGNENVVEEIVVTKNCVVYSRSQTVIRCFLLEVEQQQIIDAFLTDFTVVDCHSKDQHTAEAPRSEAGSQRAVVVVLQRQAHVYLLEGDSYVVPIPFRVEYALPFYGGFIVKKSAARKTIIQKHGSDDQRSFQVQSRPFPLNSNIDGRPSLTLTEPENDIKSTDYYTPSPPASVYCCIDPSAGLESVTAQFNTDKANEVKHKRRCQLPSGEQVIYLSTTDEFTFDSTRRIGSPLLLAVTANDGNSTCSIWRIALRKQKGFPIQSRILERHGIGVKAPLVANPFIRGTEVSTPKIRTRRAVRDSLLAASHSEALLNQHATDLKSSQVEEMAFQFGNELQASGVQTRAARRVSSVLARADLSMAPDHAFTEIPTAIQTGRKSFNRASRRGESLSGFSDRQSFGPERQPSFAGNGSIFSAAASYLGASAAHLLENVQNGDFDTHDTAHHLEDVEHDSLEALHFVKIQSIALRQVKQPRGSLRLSACTSAFKGNVQDDVCTVKIAIFNRASQDVALISLEVDQRSTSDMPELSIHARKIQNHTDVLDVCRLQDGPVSRMLYMRQNRAGHCELTLESAALSTVRILLPTTLGPFDPFRLSPSNSPQQRRDIGLRRITQNSQYHFIALQHTSLDGQVSLQDSKGHFHRLRVHLQPRSSVIASVIRLGDQILIEHASEGLSLPWWHVMQWLRSKPIAEDIELTALTVTVFSMFAPVVGEISPLHTSGHKRQRSGFLRSSSGAGTDMTEFEAMQERARGDLERSSAFAWLDSDCSVRGTPASSPSRSKRSSAQTSVQASEGNSYIKRHIDLTTEYLVTPEGEASIGPEGYLATAVNTDRQQRGIALSRLTVALHYFLQEQKLSVVSPLQDRLLNIALSGILAQLGQWLQWSSWSAEGSSFYTISHREKRTNSFEPTSTSTIPVPEEPFPPPCVFQHIDTCITAGLKLDFLTPLRSLLDSVNDTTHIRDISEYFPRLRTLDTLLAAANNQDRADYRPWLPIGVAASVNSSPAVVTKVLAAQDGPRQAGFGASRHTHLYSHDAQRDHHSLGAMAIDMDGLHSWDTSAEADRQHVSRLIFRDDRRYQEASKIVNQLRPPTAECSPEADWTEADLLEAQKEIVHHVTRRTLAVSSGRGLMNFNSRIPLLTERVPIPAFTLQCIIQPRNAAETGVSAMTFSADRAQFTEDKVCWAFFHNGASAGLTISKAAHGLDTSWILYNKPQELTNRHAGFLLALGLNGHLRTLANWVAFKYLTTKHSMTSIGLLIGLGASYLGTMDTNITRLLSVHVTCLLPPEAAELNLSPLTQTAGVMGIGLVYCNSQHRRMSEVMLSEIENTDAEEGASEDSILRDEGYRLAAGFALGFINLGQGKRLHNLHDMSIVERLLRVAIGTKNVNLVHVLDRATPGAIVAVALIFMKTDDASLAAKIDIPDTFHQFDYVRPDTFLMRTVARHLIMWSRIYPSKGFVQASLPKSLRQRYDLRFTKHLRSEDAALFSIIAGLCLAIGLKFAGTASSKARDLLISYLDHFIRLTKLPCHNYDAKLARNCVRNCQDVVALATACVMSGTGDLVVFRRLRSLHGRIDAETPYGSHLAAHMAVGSLFLGGGTHSFGTSDLAVASLLCAFYPLFPISVLDNKSHLQAFRHFWVLAAENRCLIVRDSATNYQLSVPFDLTLRNGHTETLTAPCLLPEFDQISKVKTQAPDHWDEPLEFPETGDKSILVSHSESKLGTSHAPFLSFLRTNSIYLTRRAAYEAPSASIFSSSLQALAEAYPAPSVSMEHAVVPVPRSQNTPNPLGWTFGISGLQILDLAERQLVLPCGTLGSFDSISHLKGTAVDTRLELEHGILDEEKPQMMKEDTLWQMRLIFNLVDKCDRDKQEARIAAGASSRDDKKYGGLRTEVIERLRARVWDMSQNSAAS